MKERKYLIYIDGQAISVSKEIYKTYYKMYRRERYLEERDLKHGLIKYNKFDRKDDNYEDCIRDDLIDVEQIVETKLMIEELYRALSSLNDDERELVLDLFFREKSLREAAEERDISHSMIAKRRDSILKKLKDILKNI